LFRWKAEVTKKVEASKDHSLISQDQLAGQRGIKYWLLKEK
jgi:hypothetical protein